MRLIIGIHSVPDELIDAVSLKEELHTEIDRLRKEIQKGILSIDNALEKKRLITLAWMIEDGLLTVKAAAVKGEGIFHLKTLIFSDDKDNELVAVGSLNETRNGLGGNFEQLMIAKSWDDAETVNNQKHFFDTLWNNEAEDVYVEDISEDTRNMIDSAIGNLYRRSNNIENNIISKMSEMPANFFVSGDIPSLYMHQERAVIDALSRWPVRVMFSDEVGLGKTFEAAATLAFLVKYTGIKRVVILTPKSVLQQWQDELYTHFGIDAWLYDSSKGAYKSVKQGTILMNGRNPLGIRSPNIILMSAQYARGSKGNKSVFLKNDTMLPELLIVDEAHAARITTDISGKRKKTQLYKMLEEVSSKIPHLILATATPMQKEAYEYHAMLKLLGLPKIWTKEENYNLSLKIIGNKSKPDLSDTANAGSLLYMTLKKMDPSTSFLTEEEQDLVHFFKNDYKALGDSLSRAEYIMKHWECFKNVFIKLHPARLLTVRNTRKSLTDVGYRFPQRNLKQVNLYNSDEIEAFYYRVNNYLMRECFSMEMALNPNKQINTGFIKISYQQRVASSLYSCKKSLERRYEKAKTLLEEINRTGKIPINNIDSSNDEDDEWDLFDEDFNDTHLKDERDIKRVIRAITIEKAALATLVDEANDLINTVGDKKVNESIDLALQAVNNKDIVLIFSRYTDTIDALLSEFNKRHTNYPYAIYTGNQAVIVKDNLPRETDKDEIKKELFAKNIKLVFCSDAASEGLNLQAARVLINVDVPWTPARLEQRIGRIARLGQKAKEVDVYNVWYPHSVEAKMYTRIQQRLKETNLAVGDFPEVIAKEIRRSLLQDEPVDSSLDQLKQIRNSYQTKALETLWTSTEEQVTVSERIREDLIKLCKDRFEYTEYNSDGMINVKLPNNKSVDLTADSGEKESINLKSLPFRYFDLSMYDVKYVNDSFQKISYFSDMEGNPIKFERIIDISMNDRYIEESDLLKGWPKTLLNPKNLNLEFAVEQDVDEPAVFWSNMQF